MCNRFRKVKTKENLSLIFNARPLLDRPEPRDELYPKYPAAVIRKEAGERVLDVMPWGIPLSMKGKSGQPLAPKAVFDALHASVFLPVLDAFAPYDLETEPVPYLVEEVTFPSGDHTLAGTLTLPSAPGPHPAMRLASWGSSGDPVA